MVRSFQDVRLFHRLTCLQNVQMAVQDQPGENLGTLVRSQAVRRRRGERRTAREGDGLAAASSAWRSSPTCPPARCRYGQSKLVSLARVLATEADVLLLDEPASGIDTKWVDTMLDLVEAVREQGRTVCIVEHNLHVVGRLADHTYFMELGRITAEGTIDELTNAPTTGGGLLWNRMTAQRRAIRTADDAPVARRSRTCSAGYGTQAGRVRRRPARRHGRDRRRPRPQRQRQEHDDQDRSSACCPRSAARSIYDGVDVTKRGSRAQRESRHGADPVGALRLPGPHRARQPAARRRQRPRHRAGARRDSSSSTSCSRSSRSAPGSPPAPCRAVSSAWSASASR